MDHAKTKPGPLAKLQDLGQTIEPYETQRIALATALVRAQQTAKAIAKDARNEHHRYSYVSTEALITEARRSLGANDLALVRVSSSIEETDPPHLITSYVLYHAAGGTLRLTSSSPIIEGKGRPLDKAVKSARTDDLGYLLRDLLLLPRVEPGTDIDGRDDTDYVPRDPPPRARSKAPQTPASAPGRPDPTAEVRERLERVRSELGPELVREAMGANWTPRTLEEARKGLETLETIAAEIQTPWDSKSPT